MSEPRLPGGWDEVRVRRALEHSETQTDDEAVAEDEAANIDAQRTMMEIPTGLVSAVRELLAKNRG